MTADKPEAWRTCEPDVLYRKFIVERTNGSSGPGGKHSKAEIVAIERERCMALAKQHCAWATLDAIRDGRSAPK